MSAPPMDPRASEPVERPGGFTGRFWLVVLFIFGLQLGLIFILSDRSSREPDVAEPRLEIRLSKVAPSELLPIEDPTLFVLPRRDGFSAPAWLEPRKFEFSRSDWFQPPLKWLAPATQQFGAGFARIAANQVPPAFEVVTMMRPQVSWPVAPGPVAISVPSSWQIRGELQRRHLLTDVTLPSWRSNDILTNTVVQLAVDERGEVFFPTLLERSGSEEADSYARTLANQLRFESLETTGPARESRSGPGLMFGVLIFRWQTLPQTNGVAGSQP